MLNKRRITIIFLLWFVSIGPAFGNRTVANQSKTDLDGTWILDTISSDFDGAKNAITHESLTLVISYRDPELRITRILTQKKKERSKDLIYYTDGRGENNSPSFYQNETVQSKTNWQGDILVTQGTAVMQTGGDVIIWDYIDKWQLSADRTTLIESTSLSSPRSKFGNTRFVFKQQNVKRVFRKKI